MYILRWRDLDVDEPRILAFEKLNDAKAHFNAASVGAYDGDFIDADLFDVVGESDVRRAIAAVRDGEGKLIDIDINRKYPIEPLDLSKLKLRKKKT